ncbi:FkbM family methyltransferase [Methanomethylovorans sp.]|uniref:FkbM family methyltransferase n=1 Tax=Methanomethylovorans sp. TaxID=2758717 RepID=UPI00351CA94E
MVSAKVSRCKRLAEQIIPPIIYLKMKKYYMKRKYKPAWHIIKGGNLKGREIFVDQKDGYWQKEIVDGTQDQYFFNYLAKLHLEGKVILDIGAHVGYHSMNFAQLVGQNGCVYAFEPNIFNLRRFYLNLEKNADLAKRIKIHDFAISDQTGDIEFNFSSNVDDGKSSGSFISGAHTPYQNHVYDNIGFSKMSVKTISLDELLYSNEATLIPYLLKIDVEGAENLVLEGGYDMIKKYKPLILMEIHSIFNMFKTFEFFMPLGYKIELLHEERDGRCFIAATSEVGT